MHGNRPHHRAKCRCGKALGVAGLLSYAKLTGKRNSAAKRYYAITRIDAKNEDSWFQPRCNVSR